MQIYVAVVCLLLLSVAISILYIPPFFQFIVQYKVAPYKKIVFVIHTPSFMLLSKIVQ